MSKQLTLNLAGEDRNFLFGLVGFFDYIEKATQQEPFEWLDRFDSLSKKYSEGGRISYADIKDVKVLLYAGHNTWCDQNNKDNVPFEKIEKWANGLSFDDMMTVFTTAMIAFSTGEAEAPINGASLTIENPGMTSGQKPTEY